MSSEQAGRQCPKDTGDNMSRIEDEVCKKIQQRAEVGKAKYRVTMERSDLNLVEWLTHLQEELMDAAVYVQRLIEEAQKEIMVKHAEEMLEEEIRDKHKRFFIGKWRKHSDGEFYAYLPSSCVMGDLAILKNKKNDYFELVVVSQHIETDSKWNYAWFSYTTIANKMERYDSSLFANGDNSRWWDE